jgi:NAD(P)-dependent dehydrogenase (short-subunit alcohol dehydrogenase family)
MLMNCAGFGCTKPAPEVTEEDWDRVLDFQSKSIFFCCQLTGRLMIDRGYGEINNLSSTWSARTDLGKSVCGLAKASVSYLTAGLTKGLARLGARVNAIALTTTVTKGTSRHCCHAYVLSSTVLRDFPRRDVVGRRVT